MNANVKHYLEESLAKKKGLTFYLSGSTVNGYVTRIIDDHSVEVVNQVSSKILVFLDRLDAIAMS